jgi:hypothetical protein
MFLIFTNTAHLYRAMSSDEQIPNLIFSYNITFRYEGKDKDDLQMMLHIDNKISMDLTCVNYLI